MVFYTRYIMVHCAPVCGMTAYIECDFLVPVIRLPVGCCAFKEMNSYSQNGGKNVLFCCDN